MDVSDQNILIMATCDGEWKTVVWERVNKVGKWSPYTAEVSQLLEQGYKKKLQMVWLGDVDIDLKVCVNLKDFVQLSEVTGRKSLVRRHLCDNDSAVGKGFSWKWHGDGHNVWHSYDVDVINFIECAYQEGEKRIDLSEKFPSYNYELDLIKMSQRNKRTKYKRAVQRSNVMPYPVVKYSNNSDVDESLSEKSNNMDEVTSDETIIETNECSMVSSPKRTIMEQMNGFWNKLKKPLTSDSSDDAVYNLRNSKKKIKSNREKKSKKRENSASNNPLAAVESNLNVALVNGKPWHHHWPPYTSQSQLKPVPGIDSLMMHKKTKTSNEKDETKANTPQDILNLYTEEISTVPTTGEEQVCIICYEPLSSSSSYSGDNTVAKLTVCSHMFHKACLQAMYDSGPKDSYLQCPTCKKIHGEKCGIQPPGTMVYHVLPYSLPSYSECDTIRIIYNIPSGTQGPDHPNPGKAYTSRGFPRNCYLPDNELGRKVLRLLIKAWERKLIFTIGTSSTTGEENTVTWNEIHHKTEFGCNTHGHGFPDPNYFYNILEELEAHGVTEDVYNWYAV